MIKHLITGGCSFSAGKDVDGWTAELTNFCKEKNSELTYEHTGYYSQGQDLIQKKVTLAILDAFDKNIKPEDILVVVMWSGTSRKAWHIDNQHIINKMTARWKKFVGGMSSQFLNLKNVNEHFGEWFETSNGSKFDYNPHGGWYFTVDGSDCPLDFVRDYYMFDQNVHGPGKIHSSLENIIMLQTFCKLHGIKLVNQFFMDRVYQDIENNKNHEIIEYLYKQLDFDTCILNGMFEYIHTHLPYKRSDAILLPHHDRIKLDNGRTLFSTDGFHPGHLGANLYCKQVLFPFITDKGYH